MTSKEFAQMAKDRPWLKVENVKKLNPTGMNKTESRFLLFLNGLLHRGECDLIDPHASISLKLAEDCRYIPDFTTWKGKEMTAWEVKRCWRGGPSMGHWEDDARVKIKVAAKTYPGISFIGAALQTDGSWRFELFSKTEAKIL